MTQHELMRLFGGDIKIQIQHIAQYLRNILTPKQFSYHIPIRSYNLKLSDLFENKLPRYGQAKLLIYTQIY